MLPKCACEHILLSLTSLKNCVPKASSLLSPYNTSYRSLTDPHCRPHLSAHPPFMHDCWQQEQGLALLSLTRMTSLKLLPTGWTSHLSKRQKHLTDFRRLDPLDLIYSCYDCFFNLHINYYTHQEQKKYHQKRSHSSAQIP